jgi:hypothetical protein
MLLVPIDHIVDFNFIDFLGKAKANRNGYPLPVLSGFDSIAILPFVLFVLDIVQIAKNICDPHFIEIAEPGKVLGLMYGSDQLMRSPKSFLFYGKILSIKNNIIHHLVYQILQCGLVLSA